MTYYTVYRTVNTVNGKYYLGVHKTEDPYDGYLGSGKILKRAVQKYGEGNFLKNICFVFDNPTEAFEKEFELIETYRDDPACYNLRQGGSGGFDYINQEGMNTVGVSRGGKNCGKRLKDPKVLKEFNERLAEGRRNSQLAKEHSRKIQSKAILAAAKVNRKAERRLAIEMFQQGLSRGFIARELGVAKSSVSVWVRL